jgi:hypothetical protein
MSEEKRFRIIVEQLVPDADLAREDDRRSNPAGRYLYAAGDAKQALYRFHREIPIACVDDFAVRVEEFHDANEGSRSGG